MIKLLATLMKWNISQIHRKIWFLLLSHIPSRRMLQNGRKLLAKRALGIQVLHADKPRWYPHSSGCEQGE